MRLKYLYGVQSQTAMPQANTGEPVIPSFPILADNSVFIGTVSFMPIRYGRVEDKELDVDAMATRLCLKYTGLPRGLIDNYITLLARGVHAIPCDTVLGVASTYDETRLVHTTTGATTTLWTKQPLPGA